MATSRKYAVRILIVTLTVTAFAWANFYLPLAAITTYAVAKPMPTPRPKAAARKAKYSEFPHSAKAHKLDCAACHKFPSDNWKKVRPAETAFADVTEYPKHESCLKCHTQQFFKGARPAICSICHTNPSPRDSSRHPFPNPREIFDLSAKGKKAESDFVVGFPHDKHIEIVAKGRSGTDAFVNAAFTGHKGRLVGEESCSVCHLTRMPQGTSDVEFVTPPPAELGDAFWLKKGTFKTAPTGHTTCFTCHSDDTGILPVPQTCSACHQLKPPQPPADFDAKLAASIKLDDKMMMDSWRRRDSTGAFRHEFFAHVELSCSTCHNVLTINTADPQTKRVSISSCATCHVTPTSDDGGALNYEIDSRKTNVKFECTKCHITFGKLPVPESHTNAITAASGK